MLRATALLISLLLPFHVAADGLQRVVCQFTMECLDTEPCNETDYQMSMIYMPDPSGNTFRAANPTDTPPDPFTVQVQDINGDFLAAPITGGAFGNPMTGFVAFNSEDTQRLLTISSEGTGRYSIHMQQNGLALYYEGTCKEVIK